MSFTSCKFVDSKLSNLDFGQVLLSDSVWETCLLVNCVFQKLVSGEKSITKKMSLKGCEFRDCDLSRSVFVKCGLAGVGLKKCDLRWVVFDYCDLTGVDLSESEIEGVNFETSRINKTKLSVDGFVKFGYGKGFVLAE